MKLPEIEQHYTAKNLEAVAQKLSREDAFKMYSAMESIGRMMTSEAALCAALAFETGRALAKQHLDEAENFVKYLAQQKKRYT